MKLAQRLVLYSFLLIAVLVVVIAAIVDNGLRKNITDEIAGNLAREARLVALEWTPDRDVDSLADAAGAALQRRVTRIDSAGVVRGDSEFNGILFVNSRIIRRARKLSKHTDPDPASLVAPVRHVEMWSCTLR